MKYKLFIAFLIFNFQFSIFNLNAQKTASDHPKLLVGIVVEGLQQQHLRMMWDRFSSDGFRKMADGGACFNNVQYNILSLSNITDWATLACGSVPAYHGITGEQFFDRKTHQFVSALEDEQQAGINTALKLSAKRLLSSTFVDEIKMAFPLSRVFAVTINPQAAMMLGSHKADAVAFLNDEIRWASTTYYNGGLPRTADEMNTSRTLDNYLNSVWKPLKSIDDYLCRPTNETVSGFRYDFSKDETRLSNTVLDLRKSPAANSLVTDLGTKILLSEKMGKDNAPDILLLQYTVNQVNEYSFALTSAEKEDMYYRLDKEIATLLKEIEKNVGTANTLIFLTGNQSGTHSPKELTDNNIQAGTFSPVRSMSLLNLYLMAIYGNEQWVEGYYGKSIFLNRKKIDDKKLNLSEIQQKTADFMLEFGGIADAITATQIAIMGNGQSAEAEKIKNSYNRLLGGDVVISLLPGWQETDENGLPIGVSNTAVSRVPLWFYGWQTTRQKSDRPIFITDLAPTLTDIFNIPAPNANIGQAIDIKDINAKNSW